MEIIAILDSAGFFCLSLFGVLFTQFSPVIFFLLTFVFDFHNANIFEMVTKSKIFFV